jgi:hypothetical protein
MYKMKRQKRAIQKISAGHNFGTFLGQNTFFLTKVGQLKK